MTHTFVFADLAGFTAMTEHHGDELTAELVDDFERLADSLLPAALKAGRSPARMTGTQPAP